MKVNLFQIQLLILPLSQKTQINPQSSSPPTLIYCMNTYIRGYTADSRYCAMASRTEMPLADPLLPPQLELPLTQSFHPWVLNIICVRIILFHLPSSSFSLYLICSGVY